MVAQLAGSRMMGYDPLGFAAGDTNLYRYVGNTPTNYTDPMGLAPVASHAPSSRRVLGSGAEAGLTHYQPLTL